MLTAAFLIALLSGAATASIPLLLAGLGEQISEKAGVFNIGIEGMMLMGAYGGFVAALFSGSLAIGFLGGALCGASIAAVMAILCVWRGLNQVVVGIALTLFAQGLTALLHHAEFSQSYPRLPDAQTLSLPVLAWLPILGPALFQRPAYLYLAWLCAPAITLLFRLRFGLWLQAAGDKPASLDASGIDVVWVRTAAVLATGIFAGLGGAFLAEVGAGLFVPLMTNGSGFIGIVLAMLARGRPLYVLAGATLFGACLSATTALQVAGIDVPTDVIQMLPFAAVLLALVLFGRQAGLPASLGTHYERGAR